MGTRMLHGTDFAKMIAAAARHLKSQADAVNALNVFPVPDGDTGTNMSLTLESGAQYLDNKPSPHIGQAAELLSKGLLMGARGNSGVILSQLFRGFAKHIQTNDEINSVQFAAALQQGVDMAYQAVVKPVEGTILTVAKEAARHAVVHSRRLTDISDLMNFTLQHAKEALSRTPDQLPILKQVGVVDSGGQGLVFIYEAFAQVLSGQYAEGAEHSDRDSVTEIVKASEQVQSKTGSAGSGYAQAQIATEDIEYLYDMEFFILLRGDARFDETSYRQALAQDGDSILVIPDDEVVKVHVHSRSPGDVMNLSLRYGELSRINIQNMRDQHRDLLAEADQEVRPSKKFGLISVAAGEGIAEIFTSLGVDFVLSGGQTMNPSTEDIVNAIALVDAETVFVLPNNSNIIMAAEQAKELTAKDVVVVPTKTIPQGLSAALAFDESSLLDANAQAMREASARVKSGQVTVAVRDTTMDGLEIKGNDYIAILDGKVVASSSDLSQASQQLLGRMIESGDEIITIIAGVDAPEEATEAIAQYLQSEYPDTEAEMHNGGQPVYHYIIAVE